MNLLPLLACVLPWAPTPADALVRVFLVIGFFSLEMQVVTLAGVGSLGQLAAVNVVVAAAAAAWQFRTGRPRLSWLRDSWRAVPWPGLAGLAGAVVLLNALLPVEAADPYNMQRIVHIQQTGTLAYAPDADFKVNLVGFLFELVLADLAQVPGIGGMLLRFHGLFGLQLYLLGLATVRTWLQESAPTGLYPLEEYDHRVRSDRDLSAATTPGPPARLRAGVGAERPVVKPRVHSSDSSAPGDGRRREWPWLALAFVPVVFHQLVLIKNDLFLAIPACVALAWLLTRAATAAWPEILCFSALIGLVAGYKPTNLPLAIILAAVVLFVQRGRGGRALTAVVAGGALGAIAGGLPLGMVENLRVYGDPFARAQIGTLGNVTTGFASIVESLARFSISLVDLGQVTRRVWPGRGGWGGTFGLPFIWATGTLLVHWRQAPVARWSLVIAAIHFLAFAATFPDADVAQRLAMAPALLMIAVAAAIVARDATARTPRLALVPVLVLSAAQLVLSTVNYLQRG